MPQLTSQIAHYLQMCRLEKKLSPDTLKAYRIDLTQFAAFAQDAAVDKALLGRYAAHLNQHFAPRSVKRKLASIRAFYSSLEEQEAIEESPFRRFRLHITYPKELPRAIPTGIVETLLQSVYRKYRDSGKCWPLRDALVLELLFSTGIRVSELCRLTPDNFHLAGGDLRLLIHGKGRKERALQIATPEIVSLAQRYLEAFEGAIHERHCILLNRRKKPLTPQGVRQILTRCMSEAAVDGHITPHMFRHTFATVLLDAGWTSATSKPCWATAPFPQRRSIPTSRPPGNPSSWRNAIRETKCTSAFDSKKRLGRHRVFAAGNVILYSRRLRRLYL